MSVNHVRGTMGELAVQRDLLSRGYTVYALVEQRHHPDLIVVDRSGERFSVEVRAERVDGRRERKSSDHCDVYAWVARNGGIEYEPELWQAPVEIQ